jgi:hypothetical protein
LIFFYFSLQKPLLSKIWFGTKPVLSGWQPSPSALINSLKDVENRPTRILKLPCILGIASTQKSAKVGSLPPLLFQLYPTQAHIDALPRGHLFGWVEIVDCKSQKEAQHWPFADRGSSEIGAVYKLATPLPIKGGQGRWYLPTQGPTGTAHSIGETCM